VRSRDRVSREAPPLSGSRLHQTTAHAQCRSGIGVLAILGLEAERLRAAAVAALNALTPLVQERLLSSWAPMLSRPKARV
jgi:hypothetical protein